MAWHSLGRDRKFPVDKILLGTGLLYLVSVTLWLWLNPQALRSTNTTAESLAQISTDDRQFIAYLQQSLKTLDRQTAQNANSASASPSASPPASAPTTAPPLVERVYVPIYTPPSVPQISRPAAVALTPPRPARVSLPPPPPLPRPNAAIAPLPVPPALPSALPIAPTVAPAPAPATYSLVGLLEAGDRSTVLVTANGATRRFAVGEAVGTSGWVLVGVTGQKAILSRKGSQRALEVGQGF